MLICVTSLVIVGSVFIAWEYSSSRKSLIQSITTHAEMIADSCKASVIFNDHQDAADTLKTLRLEPSIIYASIFDKDNKELAAYHRGDQDNSSYVFHPEQKGYNFEGEILTVFENIKVGGDILATLCIKSSLEPLYSGLMRNALVVVSVVLCVSLLAYSLSAKLQSIISRPILKLAKVAQNVSENKEYSVRVNKNSNDEIGVLIDSFNEMLSQIQKHKGKLIEINESLEEKVNERTAELTREVAERKQAQEKLQVFQRFVQEAAQGVGWADIEGNIIFINPALCTMFGEDCPEDTYGKPVAMYYDEQTKQRLTDEIFPEVLTNGQWIGELDIIRKGGQVVPTLNNLFPISDSEGKPVRIANILTDITERKQAEEALVLAKENAESANVAKSQFLANMSHEIRTPMNGILGFSDLLSDEHLTETQKEYVEVICHSGQNLLALIDDILDFSKIEAGQLNTEKIECSLAGVLNSAGSLMRPRATEKGIEFEIIEGDSLPAKIHSDPTRLQQCLINLIGNAIKFTEEGHVHVNVSVEELDAQPYIRFDIEDTGIGIAKDKQAKIFESFTQADGDTTRKYGGTGLGLTITKQLTELMGGNLRLLSEEGIGTTFTLLIPAGVDITDKAIMDRLAIDTEFSEPQKDIRMFSGNVLVAEDDATNQMLIKILLEQLGLEVTVVENGNEVLENMASNQFDMVLMDMQMPYLNGYKATKVLRDKGTKTPIIALTANAMKGDKEKCINCGCDEYLKKPIDRDELIKMLDKYLSPACNTSVS